MMRAVPPLPLPAPSGSRRLAPGLIAVLLLAACSTSGGGPRGVVGECAADPSSAACAAAREGFQTVRYPTLQADRLVAAASRALGDLNFEPQRDDARRQISGRYIAGAPVHDKQLDQLFRQTLKAYAPGQDLDGLSAEVSVLPLAGSDTGANVRLQLFLAGNDGAPHPVDAVGPYQIFFSQLGAELGAPPAPPPDDSPNKRQKRPVVPSISGV
jgi:hypothetical protein